MSLGAANVSTLLEPWRRARCRHPLGWRSDAGGRVNNEWEVQHQAGRRGFVIASRRRPKAVRSGGGSAVRLQESNVRMA